MDKEFGILLELEINDVSIYEIGKVNIVERFVNILNKKFDLVIKFIHKEKSKENESNKLINEKLLSNITIVEEFDYRHIYPKIFTKIDYLCDLNLVEELYKYFQTNKYIIKNEDSYRLDITEQNYLYLLQDPESDWGYMDDADSSIPSIDWAITEENDSIDFKDTWAIRIKNIEDFKIAKKKLGIA